jgi:hypothetical protein
MTKKGLFVLHEGVGSTIFTSQVMEHSLSMRRNGISFAVLTFETFKKERVRSERNLNNIRSKYADVAIELKSAVNIYLPLSTLVNAFLLVKYLLSNRGKFSFIHARADYTAFLCLLTKPLHRLPVVWDCRGDAVGELKDSLSRRSFLLRATLGAVLVQRQRLIAGVCRWFADGAIFVSGALRSQQASLSTTNYAVVPCPVPESKFFYDEMIRREARAKHQIDPSQQVFVYSGSVVAYQGLASQLELYKRLLAVRGNVIFFATSGPEEARAYFHTLPVQAFRIINVSYDQMNEVYNLADFAFMMREPKNLNWVASPTKFGEYCLAGLPVILNDTVQQASENATTLGNHIHIDQVLQAERFPGERRATVAEAAKAIYSRSASAYKYVRVYANLLRGVCAVGQG